MSKKTDPALGRSLSMQSLALRRCGAVNDADVMEVLAKYCIEVVTAPNVLDTTSQITDSGHHESSERAALLVGDLRNVIEPGGRKALVADLDRMASLLKEHGHMSLEKLIKLILKPSEREPSVAEQGARLKAMLGEPEFPDVLAAVANPKAFKASDALALAQAMGFNPHNKLSKPKLVAYILAIHRDMQTLKAKNAAMRGRSAA